MHVNRDDLILQAIAGRTPNAQDFVRVNCPFCDMRTVGEDRSVSFALNARTGWYSCFRCGIRGKFRGELDFDLAPVDDSPKAAPEKIEPPEGYTPLWEGDGQHAYVFGAARRYLARRGVDSELMRTLQIGACACGDFAGRIIIPVLDESGEWLWYVGRAWSKHAIRRYHYPKGRRDAVLFNRAALFVETTEPVLIVEGVFDAIPHWPNAVACLGKPNDAQRNVIAEARRPVVVALDGDAWEEGWAEARRLILRGLSRCSAVRLPPKTDPGDTPSARLASLAAEALAAQCGQQ